MKISARSMYQGQSHYTKVCGAWSHFYEIWANFGSVGNTEKKLGGQKNQKKFKRNSKKKMPTKT